MDQKKDSSFYLEHILKTTRRMFSFTRLDDMLKDLVNCIREEFDYAIVAILFYDQDNNEFILKSSSGFYSNDMSRLRFSADKGLCGLCLRENSVINCPDVGKSEFYYSGGEEGVLSELVVPIYLDNQFQGVLDIQSRELNSFRKEDEEFMKILAEQISLAIKNTNLFTQMERTKKYMQEIIDNSGDAIFALRADGTIITWNKGAQQMYGYSEKETLGKNVDELVDPKNHTRTAAEVVEIVRRSRGVFKETEVIRRKKDGSLFPVSATYSLHHLDDEEVLSVIEKDLEWMKQKLKLDAAKTLFTTLLHYVNNAMSPVYGRVQIYEEERTEENMLSVVESALYASKKMVAIMDSISRLRNYMVTPYYKDDEMFDIEKEIEKMMEGRADKE